MDEIDDSYVSDCVDAGGMSTQLLSLTVNTQLQHVCIGRSTAVDIVCYDSNGSKSLSQSTVGVGVFAMSYNILSGQHDAV